MNDCWAEAKGVFSACAMRLHTPKRTSLWAPAPAADLVEAEIERDGWGNLVQTWVETHPNQPPYYGVPRDAEFFVRAAMCICSARGSLRPKEHYPQHVPLPSDAMGHAADDFLRFLAPRGLSEGVPRDGVRDFLQGCMTPEIC